MHVIANSDDNIFSLNGIKYLKNYISRVYGNQIEIFNCYEKADVLVQKDNYQNFTVNGIAYPNVLLLQEALLNVLFNRTTFNEIIVPDASSSLKGKIRLAGDISGTADSPLIPALAEKLPIQTVYATGNTINFRQDKIYGSVSTPVTGALTTDLTGAKLGVTNLIIHNSISPPIFETRYKKYIGSQNYIPSANNYIYMVYLDDNNINYLIQYTI